MSKIIKNIFKLLGVLVLLLIIAAVAIPYFYKDELVSYLKEDTNKLLDATLDFSDLSISLFKSFPNLQIEISDFSLLGKNDFEGLPLVKTDRLFLDVDLMSVLKKEQDIRINSIDLDHPSVNIKVLKDGRANYNIYTAPEDSEQNPSNGESLDFLANLDAYSITAGNVSYIDRSSGLEVILKNLNHKGSGSFSQDVFDLDTETNIDKFTFSSGGVSYLANDKIFANLVLGVDMQNSSYTIKENDLRINALNLSAEGIVKQVASAYDLNLNIKAPGNDFKELLSIIPGVYTKDFDKIKALGNFSLVGKVNGLYDADKKKLPNFDLGIAINDGSFSYPSFGKIAEAIQTKINIVSKGNNLDNMTVDLKPLSFKMNNKSFESQIALKQLISNPAFKGFVNGTIDLDFLGKAMQLEGVQSLTGQINSNIKIDASYNQLELNQVENLKLSGTAGIQNLNYAPEAGLPVKVNTANLTFTPKALQIENLDLKYGQSDFKGSGSVDNILAYFLPSKTLVGRFDFSSDYINVNELAGLDASTEVNSNNAPLEPTPTNNEEVFDRFDFEINGKMASLDYDVYPLRDVFFNGTIKPNALNISKAGVLLGKSDFALSGNIKNLFNYLYSNQDLTGELNLGSKYTDLNGIMAFGEKKATAKSTQSQEDYAVVTIPERTNINIKTNIQKVDYTDLTFTKAKGNIKVADKAAELQNLSMNGFGGVMGVKGTYDTKEIDKPTFDLAYSMKKVSFQKLFEKFNTFKVFAPIGKYIKGELNTDLSFNGILGKDLIPDMNTLSAEGFLQTLNGTLAGLPALEKVSKKLNIDLLKKMQIKNTKNWFEIKDGKMVIKDFNQSINNIKLKIGGSHSLSNDMAYTIIAKIPRELINKSKVGALADQGLNLLLGKASKAGINLDQGAFVNLKLLLGGSMQAPTLKVDVLGTDGQTSIKDQVINEVKETATQKVEEVKTVVKDKVDDEKAKLKAKMDKEIAGVMKLAETQAKKIKTAGKKAANEARKLGFAKADQLVAAAGNNIFKKKAAEIAAKKLKQETEKKALNLEQQANKKADGVLKKAKEKADLIRKKYGNL